MHNVPKQPPISCVKGGGGSFDNACLICEDSVSESTLYTFIHFDPVSKRICGHSCKHKDPQKKSLVLSKDMYPTVLDKLFLTSQPQRSGCWSRPHLKSPGIKFSCSRQWLVLAFLFCLPVFCLLAGFLVNVFLRGHWVVM